LPSEEPLSELPQDASSREPARATAAVATARLRVVDIHCLQGSWMGFGTVTQRSSNRFDA
jgi:hypothetical protein